MINPTVGNDVTQEAYQEAEGREVELEELVGLQIGNDAIGAVAARRLLNAKTISKPAPIPIEEEDDEDEAPLLVNHGLPNLRAVLDEADVVIEVLDARDPLAFRSSHLEELAAGKRVLLILNKIGQSPIAIFYMDDFSRFEFFRYMSSRVNLSLGDPPTDTVSYGVVQVCNCILT